MEENREPRNKLKTLRSINIWQRRQEHKMEQKQPLRQIVLGDLDSYVQKNETRSPTYTVNKNNSRWMKDLNISRNTVKVLEENIGRQISDIPRSNILTDMFPKARHIKERINKWDLIKIKSFCMAKKTAPHYKENQQYGKTYLPMIPQTRAWSPKYIQNSHDCTPGRQTTQLKNGQRTWTDTSPRKTYRGPRDIWKEAQHHYHQADAN